MTVAGEQFKLDEEQLRKHYPAAERLLEGFDHAPRLAKPNETAQASSGRSNLPTRRRFRSTTPGLVTQNRSRPDGVHLAQRVEDTGDDALPTPLQATVLQGLRRGIAVALAVGEQYADVTGLTALKKTNLSGRLSQDSAAEFGELLTAEALVVLHACANSVSFLLGAHAGETPVEIGAIEEVLTDNAPLALHGTLWELDQALAKHASDDAQLAATTLAWAEQVMEAAARRAEHATRLAPYADADFRVEADDLTLRGFTPARRGASAAPAMAFKTPEQVVGNHIAKYQAMKLAKMLMAYDFDRRMNPFAELGGFIFTFMGDGAPGTGKTTLIQMMAGLIHGYCEVAGYSFRYRNLSTETIDSYQGKSGQNAKAFIDEIMDPHVIGFGTIDDIDQLAGKRGDRQSSAGQLEITSVLMNAFAGANTVVRGNCTFGMFSNFPENVDDALRQRAGARFLVDGPQTQDDYIDILTLLLGRGHDIPLGDHELYAGQEIQRAVRASYDAHAEPKEAGLKAVWAEVATRVGPLDTLAKLGSYLKGIQQADERFTGRAIKNITDAVKVRAMDVELPDDWMQNPDLFLFRDYDTKRAMIDDLRQPITAEMVVQEINRYADSEFRYADNSDEVAIENAVREMERMEEARRRYGERRA